MRTSPDHGTAFDIAGAGIADPRSMIAAIHLAVELVERRRSEMSNRYCWRSDSRSLKALFWRGEYHEK